MSTGIVLVLHADADSAYAAELTAALAPLPTIAVPLSRERTMRFGGGAACLLIWSDAAAAQLDVRTIASMLNDSATVICARNRAVPEDLRARARSVVAAQGAIAADAEGICALFSAREPQASPITIRQASPSEANGRSGGMLMRSALSLTATIAIAGAVTPIIVDRAQATNNTQAAGDVLPDDGDIDMAELDAASVETVAMNVPPTLETLLLENAEMAAAPAPAQAPVVLQEASYAPAPEPFSAFSTEPFAMLESAAPMRLDVVLPIGAMGVEVAHAKPRHQPASVVPLSGKTNT